MTVTWIVTLSVCVQMMFCLLWNSDGGVTIKYNITFGNVCWSDEGRFAFIYGVSLDACVQECGLRKHCKALTFHGRSNVCKLFSSDNGVDVYQGECIGVLSQDIEVVQEPCNDCVYGEVCDTTTKQCIYKECASLVTLDYGTIFGNMRSVGSKIRFKCNDGYSLKNGTTDSECTASGSWTATAECVQNIDCGPLSDILYGTKTVTATTHGGIATYTCNYGYQLDTGDTTRTCVEGMWDGREPSCKIKDCGQPAGITHGSVYAPVTTHGATANYTCDVEYQITAGNAVRTCTDGVWVDAIPVCSLIPNIGCYLDGQSHLFIGTHQITKNGLNCQRWDSQYPHNHIRTSPVMFPSGDISANENYCRDPDEYGKPWCYTTDQNVRWEVCAIPLC